MPRDEHASEQPPARPGGFVTTHWTVVLAAGRSDSTHARDALAQLCQAYWYPLYAYVRRRGNSPEDSEDLTQEFFARLLERQSLAKISREHGRFRSFLLTAMNHFLVDEWKRARTQRRGAQRVVSLDAGEAETRFRREPPDPRTAEKIFQRNWALALLDAVFLRLQQEYESTGKSELFGKLKFCLTGERSSLPYVELAAQLDVPENTLKTAVHRLRLRYRELLRAEVAQTVNSPGEVEDELRDLFRAVAG